MARRGRFPHLLVLLAAAVLGTAALALPWLMFEPCACALALGGAPLPGTVVLAAFILLVVSDLW